MAKHSIKFCSCWIKFGYLTHYHNHWRCCFRFAFAPTVLHTLFQLLGEHKPLILAVLNCSFFHAPSNYLCLMARPMRCSWTFINMTTSFKLVGLCLCVTFCAYIVERRGWVCWKVGKHERTYMHMFAWEAPGVMGNNCLQRQFRGPHLFVTNSVNGKCFTLILASSSYVNIEMFTK
jgi:hypothetical protein